MAKTKLSVSQLKKDAKKGNIIAEMVIRCGEECTAANIPERLKGKRLLVDSNSVAVFFLNADGEKSPLRLPSASLVEYTENSLTIYYPGYREPNEEEQKALNEWKNVEATAEYQKQFEYDCLCDGSSSYWRKVRFFKERNLEYLRGHEEKRGLILDFNRKNAGEPDFIRDESIRGKVAFKYILSHEIPLKKGA